MNAIVILLLIAIGILALIAPGIIANRRRHAYRNIIWALSIVGLFNGLTWIIAMIWAVWPTEKSIVDPIIGNVTGTGSRNVGDAAGSVVAGYTLGKDAEVSLRTDLKILENLRNQGIITEEKYTKKRGKLLNI